MKISYIKKIEELKCRKKEIYSFLNKEISFFKKEKFRDLYKEYTKIVSIINYFEKWKKINLDIESTKSLLQDVEMKDIAKEEIKKLCLQKESIEDKLKFSLLSNHSNKNVGCFIEIRAGTGGSEAAIFANDLFRMYVRFAEQKKWKVKVVSAHESDHNGYKEIIIKVSNKSAYNLFKFESGGHRVQRIPKTESQGRVHTSSCTVAVIPEIPKEEILKINTSDLRIDTFRSSGCGGQHVNTTNSAVRITHIPTGLTVECQEERSQHKNKARALSILASRIRTIEEDRKKKEDSFVRKVLLGTGDRSDRIRTYNFPQRRVTDHRIKLTVYKLEEIISGNLNILIQPLMEKHQIEKF